LTHSQRQMTLLQYAGHHLQGIPVDNLTSNGPSLLAQHCVPVCLLLDLAASVPA
jgi:hypothetical protein